MNTTRICHICGTKTQTWCPTCSAAMTSLPAASSMTPEERVTELERWYGPLEVPFDLMHKRIDELVGRPTWTHELINKDSLIHELRHPEDRATMQDIIKKIADKESTLLVVVGEDE